MSMSWFPFNFNFSLPSLTPPLSIQRRFISFLLRRSLGHLLKPGQLDISQIDAQIGSGFVEVKDLELDCNAINSLLGCQPLQLESGAIATVTARIPWPNPFSSTVGLSLSRLRLNLLANEGVDLPPIVDHSDDLANSVASVAETFIHDELTEKEEAQLRQSIHEGQGAFDDIPGSMSFFLGEDEDAPQKHINDPEGVSIFAGLFESLLARFDFDASDSQISMMYDDVVLTLDIGQIHYFTTAGPNQGQTSESRSPSIGEKRSIQISGLKMAMHDKNIAASRPSSPGDARTRNFGDSSIAPREGSDTELDDETQAMMSQSLASLPAHPRCSPNIRSSLSLSTNSSTAAVRSMYESAMSTIEPSSRPYSSSTVVDTLLPSRSTEKIILSVSEPITFQLTTPPVAALEANTNSESSPASNNREKEQFSDRMKLDASSGIIVISLDARCVRCLLRLVDALTSAYCRRPDTVSSRPNETFPTMLDRIDISLHLKGLIALILGSTFDETEVTHLSHFHERPLVPPRLAGGYARVHVDSVKMALESRAPSESRTLSASFRQSSSSSPPLLHSSISHKFLVSCTAADFSILLYHAFRSTRSNNEEPNYFSPLLITDHHLEDSYRYSSIRRGARADSHVHPYSDEEKNSSLPDVDVVEWYSEHVRTQGTSLRPWRTRVIAAPYRRSASRGLGADFVSNVGLATSPTTRTTRTSRGADVPLVSTRGSSAISVRMRLGGESEISSVIVETVPLHLFVNLELLRPVTDFLDVALPDTNNSVRTEPASPSSGQYKDTENEDQLLSPDAVSEERRRLEKFVLEDLNLDLDYIHSGDATPRRRASPPQIKPKRQRGRARSKAQLDVLIPLVRVEIRAPPPRNHEPRTGSLVLDLHSVHFSKSAPDSKGVTQIPRFATTNEANGFEEWFDNRSQSVPVSLEVRRVVVAYAALSQSTAKTVLSLGPISDAESGRTEDGSSRHRLFPLFLFRNSESSGDPTSQGKPTALLARIPSVHATVGKAYLDGLQLWIDDVTQWIGRLTSGRVSETSTEVQVSRASSLIGSRYFIERSGSGSTDSETAGGVNPTSAKSELVIKLCFSETFIRLVVPTPESTVPDANRFIDICASDLDTLIEVKPEGKDETVVSLNVLVASVKETSTEASHDVIMSRLLSIDRKRPSVFTLRFRSVSLPGSVAKESKVRMILDGLTINLWSDVMWVKDLVSFVRAPPGAFESVIPSERTHFSINVRECALRIAASSRPSAFTLSLGDVTISTDLVSDPQEMVLDAAVSDVSILLNDDSNSTDISDLGRETDAKHWMSLGYALLATLQGLTLRLKHNTKMLPTNAQITLNGMLLNVHLCADTVSGIIGFVSDLQSLFPVSTETNSVEKPSLPRGPTRTSVSRSSTLLRSLDEQAFRRQPVIGPLPDMVNDDLPKNPEYLDASFGAAAGLRALDDDEDDLHPEDPAVNDSSENIISRHGGETIKMLYSPIEIIENFFDTLTPSSLDFASEHGEMSFRVRTQDCEVHVLLYDGYDWERTRHAIREEVKRVKRRLAKIRQLLASGQTYDPNVDATSSVLFNSVYVGLEQDPGDLEGEALLAAIDDELAGDTSDVMSEGSWQSFQPEGRARTKPSKSKTAIRANKLDRATKPSIEFALRGMAVDFDQYLPGSNLASRLLSTIRDLEILDHIKTSTWSTFLTELRTDSRGNIRETGSNMVRIELQTLQPFEDNHEQEARLKAKILPLRLHVDQDALDFLKAFFSFKDNQAEPPSSASDKEIFFQHVEIFPVDIKLDYKPRRVDYKALKEGRTIELMNFFHFDGSEMTLRHLTLKGVTGWARLFDLLNDLWTPDVKANQLADIISGVSPIRSAVNVGSGIADLVLLPIAQYKKDGRVIRGLQKGATAFMKSTAMEAIRLGTRLATGTQVVLEQTEHVLGAQFSGPVTAEALQSPDVTDLPSRQTGEDTSSEDLYSRYAEQPVNVKEGVQSAYRSLSQNIKYAGQTILAVPMEVYERSSTEGPARAVIRAVPIAVLKPMIGASEAISKTLMGLHNTLDPQAQIEAEAKYKHR